MCPKNLFYLYIINLYIKCYWTNRRYVCKVCLTSIKHNDNLNHNNFYKLAFQIFIREELKEQGKGSGGEGGGGGGGGNI